MTTATISPAALFAAADEAELKRYWREYILALARSIHDTALLVLTFRDQIEAWEESGDPTARRRIDMLELALFSIKLWKRLEAGPVIEHRRLRGLTESQRTIKDA